MHARGGRRAGKRAARIAPAAACVWPPPPARRRSTAARYLSAGCTLLHRIALCPHARPTAPTHHAPARATFPDRPVVIDARSSSSSRGVQPCRGCWQGCPRWLGNLALLPRAASPCRSFGFSSPSWPACPSTRCCGTSPRRRVRGGVGGEGRGRARAGAAARGAAAAAGRPPLPSPLPARPPARHAVRHWYSIITGFALVYYPFGGGCANLVAASLLTYALMRGMRQHCGTLTWLVIFPYLIAW